MGGIRPISCFGSALKGGAIILAAIRKGHNDVPVLTCLNGRVKQDFVAHFCRDAEPTSCQAQRDSPCQIIPTALEDVLGKALLFMICRLHRLAENAPGVRLADPRIRQLGLIALQIWRPGKAAFAERFPCFGIS